MYGDYELVSEIAASRTAVVHLARKGGKHYAIKIFQLLLLAERDSRESKDLDDLGEDFQRKFLEGAKAQRQAAAKACQCAPIHDAGNTEEGSWYATDYYLRGALKRKIAQRVELSAADLRSLIFHIIDALLGLKSAIGRSHGNLKAANILLGGDKGLPLGSSPLFLTDLKAGDESDAVRFERADLHALGELILQLVTGREVRADEYDFANPILEEWSKLGPEHQYWFDLSKRLVSATLTLQGTSLGSLAAELKPRRSWVSAIQDRAPVVAKVAAATAVLGALVWLILFLIPRPSPYRHLVQATNQWQQARTSLARSDFKEAVTGFDRALGFCERARKVKLTAEVQKLTALLGHEKSAALLQERQRFDATLAAAFASLTQGEASLRAGAWSEASANIEIASKQCTQAEALTQPPGTASALRSRIDAAKSQLQAGLECQSAKAAADAAEKTKDWGNAVRQWQSAEKVCGSDSVIKERLRFAGALSNVQATLQQRGAKQANEQILVYTNALAALDKVVLLANSEWRRTEWNRLSNGAALGWQEARSELINAQAKSACDRAKALAEAAEKSGEWSTALPEWRSAGTTCGNDPQITEGLTFAAAMTNVQWTLNLWRSRTPAEPVIQAYSNALHQLQTVESLAIQPWRASAWRQGSNSLVLGWQETSVALDKAKRAQDCTRAKDDALALEKSRRWRAAWQAWQAAENICGNDSSIREGMDFASAITNAEWTLGQTQPTNEQVVPIYDQAIGQLRRVAPSATREWRSAEWLQLSNALAHVTEKARDEGRRTIQFAHCQEAINAAEQAEKANDLTAAAEKWQTAQNYCPTNPFVAQGIAFVMAMTNAQRKLAEAERLVRSDPPQATQMGTTVLESLQVLPPTILNPWRRSAVEKLREALLRLRQNAQANLVQQDLDKAESLFRVGQVQPAFQLSQIHTNEESFTDLARRIADYAGLESEFSQGKYGWIDRLQDQDYSAREPFLGLLARARQERENLGQLNRLLAMSNWAGLQDKWRELGQSNFLTKPPFVAIQRWLETHDPRKKLDEVTELFKIWFDVPRTREDPIIDNGFRQIPGTKKNAAKKSKSIILPDYFNALDFLRAEYRKRGLTPPPDLEIVEKKITLWR